MAEDANRVYIVRRGSNGTSERTLPEVTFCELSDLRLCFLDIDGHEEERKNDLQSTEGQKEEASSDMPDSVAIPRTGTLTHRRLDYSIETKLGEELGVRLHAHHAMTARLQVVELCLV